MSGDLGSLSGVRALVEQVTQLTPRGLHMLVNNARGAFRHRALSLDGVELTLAVNHLPVAALTSAVMDALHNSAANAGRPSRMVNLSSTMEGRGHPKLEHWTYPSRFSQLQAYSDSKLVNLTHTYALARTRWRRGNCQCTEPRQRHQRVRPQRRRSPQDRSDRRQGIHDNSGEGRAHQHPPSRRTPPWTTPPVVTTPR